MTQKENSVTIWWARSYWQLHLVVICKLYIVPLLFFLPLPSQMLPVFCHIELDFKLSETVKRFLAKSSSKSLPEFIASCKLKKNQIALCYGVMVQNLSSISFCCWDGCLDFSYRCSCPVMDRSQPLSCRQSNSLMEVVLPWPSRTPAMCCELCGPWATRKECLRPAP